MKAIRKLATAIVLATATAAVAAYPERPIKIVVPFAAGGPSDAIARTLGRALSASVGQPVVVENKPGAEGLIAAQSVFSAPPDGYTLFLSGTSSSVALSALRKDPGFDPLQFTPVTTVAAVTFCLYVNPDVPARTVAELVAHAKANPGKLNYAVAANSEFMAASQLMKATEPQVVGVAMVLEGDGFWASTARSVMASIMFMSNTRYPTKVFGTAVEGDRYAATDLAGNGLASGYCFRTSVSSVCSR